MPVLVSVNVGTPRDVPWKSGTVHTAIWKRPVQGPRLVRRLNIDGDAQGDLSGHGGEQRAVLVYQLDSYRHWNKVLGRDDFAHGQFGENFTVEGMADDEVCIGDRYRIGEAVFEVTQPRVTCYRVGIRMNEPQMAALMVSHHRPGFYLRVLTEGLVRAGAEIIKVAAGPEPMTVAEIDALLYLPGHPRRDVARALRIPALSPGWKGSLQAIVDRGDAGPGSGNVGLNEAAASPAPAWNGFRSLRITRRVVETPTVVSLWLGGGNDGPLAEAAPGQFVALRLRPDPNAPAIIRSYSLSGPPAAGEYRISVKREPGGAAGSQLHDHVQVGDAVEVSAPRGTFSLRDRDTPIVLASAGIGVTPVLAMLHTLADRHTPQEVWWLHGARNRREHAFADEAHRLLAELPNAHAHTCYSAPGSPDELSDPDTTQGRLSVDLVALLKVPVESDVYMCGPPPFMAELGAGLVGLGFEPSRIHREIFAPLAAVTPGIARVASPPPHPPAGPQGEGPAVSFARSGLTVNWNPRYVDLLELAEACDVSTRWSCRAGVCHTCETAMLSGSVVYAPEPVDAPAAGNVLLCCAQPTTEAVLDL